MSCQLLWCALALAAFLHRASSKGSNIIFDDSDLSTTDTSDHGEFLLEAFKAAGNDRILQSEGIEQRAQLRWFSLGEPQLVRVPNPQNSSKETVLDLKSDRVRVLISTLRASHATQLASIARDKYEMDIGNDQILPLPLSHVACSITMTDEDGQQLLLTGNASYVRAPLIRVDFMAPNGNPARRMLERQMDNGIDELSVECVFSSAGSPEEDSRPSTFELTTERIAQLGIIEKLFGGRDEIYATRGQLMQLASDIYSTLSTQKDFNVTLDKFSKEFIRGLLLHTRNSSFSGVDVDEVLSALSAFDPNAEPQSPEKIRTVLNSLFTTRIIKKQKRISLNQPLLASVTRREGGPTSSSAVTSIFGINIGPRSKISSWNIVAGSKLLGQQLSELNSFAESDVHWKVERDRILPTTVRVAKLWRDGFSRTIPFNQIANVRAQAEVRFSRTFVMEVGFAVPLPAVVNLSKQGTRIADVRNASSEQPSDAHAQPVAVTSKWEKEFYLMKSVLKQQEIAFTEMRVKVDLLSQRLAKLEVVMGITEDLPPDEKNGIDTSTASTIERDMSTDMDGLNWSTEYPFPTDSSVVMADDPREHGMATTGYESSSEVAERDAIDQYVKTGENIFCVD